MHICHVAIRKSFKSGTRATLRKFKIPNKIFILPDG